MHLSPKIKLVDFFLLLFRTLSTSGAPPIIIVHLQNNSLQFFFQNSQKEPHATRVYFPTFNESTTILGIEQTRVRVNIYQRRCNFIMQTPPPPQLSQTIFFHRIEKGSSVPARLLRHNKLHCLSCDVFKDRDIGSISSNVCESRRVPCDREAAPL